MAGFDEFDDYAEIERQMRLLYPNGPPRPAQVQEPPGLKLGRFNIPGGALDGAAMAVLQAMQGQGPPRGFGGGFVQGLAGGRARNAAKREDANEVERKRVKDEQEEMRLARRQAGQHLANSRWDMYRQRAAAKEREEADSVPNTPELQKELAGQHIFVSPRLARVPKSALVRDQPRPSQGNPYLQLAETAGRRTAINTLVDNVRQDPDVRDFVTVRDQRKVGKGAAASKTSAGDIILMRALARASDPQTGVREEEFRTFQGAQGVLDAIGVRLGPEMVGQGKLNDKGRAFLISQLENIYQNKKLSHLSAVTFYRGMAADLGLDPNRTVRDFVGRDDDAPTPMPRDIDIDKKLEKKGVVKPR